MNIQRKRQIIKDPVWGNIELLPWEIPLLSHFLVNRLHNVIQNSSAFRVYPGLKYSRFVHSIGTMHVASQMFINTILNSTNTKCLKLIKTENNKCLEFFSDILKEPQNKIQKRFSFVSLIPEYNCLHSAIRVSALLHDIGHLPYSHTFEFAIEQFINENKISNELISIKNRLIANIYDNTNQESKSKKPHELIGKSFLDLLINQFSNNNDFSQNPLPQIIVASKILFSSEFKLSSSFISGTIDADRIDFIRRDGQFSGLFNSSVNYDRLFSFFELNILNEEVTLWPSERAQSDIEKLLWERFLDYKYIATHHKVHLFDELLERFIYYSLIDGTFSKQLETLCNIFELSKNLETYVQTTDTDFKLAKTLFDLRITLMTSFDDPWLDIELRNSYKQVAGNSEKGDQISKRKQKVFETLNEKRNLFTSMFKQDKEFYKIFGKNIIKNCNDKAIPLNDFAVHITNNKIKWEYELEQSHEIIAIIGDTSKKLKDGIDEQVENLLGLKKFLSLKRNQSPIFNIWYCADKEGINKKLESFINNKIQQYFISKK